MKLFSHLFNSETSSILEFLSRERLYIKFLLKSLVIALELILFSIITKVLFSLLITATIFNYVDQEFIEISLIDLTKRLKVLSHLDLKQAKYKFNKTIVWRVERKKANKIVLFFNSLSNTRI